MLKALNVQIAELELAVELDQVSKLLELSDRQRPPLAERWLSGFVQVEDRAVPCVSLSMLAPVPLFGGASGLLIGSTEGRQVALEVDSVLGIEMLERVGELASHPEWIVPDGWMRRCFLASSRRERLLIDAEAILHAVWAKLPTRVGA